MNSETEAAVVAALAAIQVTLEDNGKVLESLDHAINGNGQPGLKVMVDRHENTISTAKKLFWIVGTPILAAMGSGVVAVSVYFIKHL